MQLNLSPLVRLIDEIPAYKDMIKRLGKKNTGARTLLLDAAKPFLLAALYQDLRRPMVVITAQPENAKRLSEQISLWSNSEEINLFPEPDILPYQQTISDFSVEQERLRALYSLVETRKGKMPPLVVSSAPALIQKMTSRDDFTALIHTIEVGTEVDPLSLMEKWSTMGYQVETMVERPGSISRRGGIIDIYPPTSDLPVRLEFFGNTVESIRFFDPASQRSQKVIPRVVICPATEISPLSNKVEMKEILSRLNIACCSPESREQYEQDIAMISSGQRPPAASFYAALVNNGNLLDYLSPEAVIVLDERPALQDEIQHLDEQASGLRQEKIEAGELPDNFPVPYFQWDEIAGKLKNRTSLELLSWTGAEDPDLLRMDFHPAPSYAGQLPVLTKKARGFLDQGRRLLIISNQASRLSELMEQEDILAEPQTEIKVTPPSGSLTLLHGSLEEGWQMGSTYLLTDREVFGFVKERRFLKRRPIRRHKLLVDIKPGDFVVHIEHGIGQFMGVINMSTDSTQKEYLVLTYAAGDKLYVPTDQIDRVGRYIGTGEDSPALNRLGTQEWNRTKQKVKESVEEIAYDLLQLYAAREVLPGHAYPEDTVWQGEMEASFPYVETPDQIKVQEEVKEDMARPKPMDRLVVGDVGYGKTEIAIRAAFKAVMGNKQVAVLVPTTVLAEQHYLTFKQRMGAFPVKIEVLSRFRKPRDQQRVIAGLADGSIDICIGTHRLLQKDVVFKDLGLIVIDEEQRFGVFHKEHLKKLREQVDVLTLSATPIPRTMHMSLVGVRDMSIIETPPENRLPIKTYVAEYSSGLIREAILREIERNGQVFFVHNRVQGISAIADRIKQLVPEANIDIAHGQMPEETLERVMHKFQRGETNVLVCTTIIESGLDLPNVNTLIVNRADRFGLTQLYQLRGRIGRGSNLAYAYFLYDRDIRLNPTAEKRLRTIFEATDLGAGFGIAMRDLEIRGAGNLLGTKQSGNISAIGFNLYTQMLAQAVEEQKARMSGERKEARPIMRPETSVDLPLKAFIPGDYIMDTDLRLSVYQKLTGLTTAEQVDDLSNELTDRFGKLPVQAENLLYAVKLKVLASQANIESISTNDSVVTVRLFAGRQLNRKKLGPYYRYGIRVGISQLIINIQRLGKDWPRLLEEIIRAVR